MRAVVVLGLLAVACGETRKDALIVVHVQGNPGVVFQLRVTATLEGSGKQAVAAFPAVAAADPLDFPRQVALRTPPGLRGTLEGISVEALNAAGDPVSQRQTGPVAFQPGVVRDVWVCFDGAGVDCMIPLDAAVPDGAVTIPDGAVVPDGALTPDARIPDGAVITPDARIADAAPPDADCTAACGSDPRTCGIIGGCNCGGDSYCKTQSGNWCTQFCSQAKCLYGNCSLPPGASCNPSQDYLYHMCDRFAPSPYYCLGGTCSQ